MLIVTFNPLVPERPSLDVFRLFSVKMKVFLIFTMTLWKSLSFIFLSNTADLKTVELIAYQWATKNSSPIWHQIIKSVDRK